MTYIEIRDLIFAIDAIISKKGTYTDKGLHINLEEWQDFKDFVNSENRIWCSNCILEGKYRDFNERLFAQKIAKEIGLREILNVKGMVEAFKNRWEKQISIA